MGVSNFFYEGAKTVKGFAKASLDTMKRKAGEYGNPAFRVIGKLPGTPVAWKSPKHKFTKK